MPSCNRNELIRHRVGCFALALILVAGCNGGTSESPRVVDADVAFMGVSIIPMTGDTVLTGQNVLIRDDVIVAIGPADEVVPADGGMRVDGEGRFLMPGLADMHVHFAGGQYEGQLDATLKYVANGVTTVRNMRSYTPSTNWRSRLEESGEIVPRIFTAGNVLDGDPPLWPGTLAVDGPETAIEIMDRQRAAGFDFLKILDGISPDAFHAIAAHSAETGFGFVGHVPLSVPLDEAMRSGIRTIEHFTGWDGATAAEGSPLLAARSATSFLEQRSIIVASLKPVAAGEASWDSIIDEKLRREFAELAARNDVWHVPTLVTLDRIALTREQAEPHLSLPEMQYLHPFTLAYWNSSLATLAEVPDEDLLAMQALTAEHLRRIKALHDAGAGLLIGTDSPTLFVHEGVSVHEELGYFVRAGLSNYDALVAATRAPAEFLGDSRFGTVEVGSSADLLLLEDNPLEDISATRTIAGVSLRGRWLPKSELDARLAAIAEKYRLLAE